MLEGRCLVWFPIDEKKHNKTNKQIKIQTSSILCVLTKFEVKMASFSFSRFTRGYAIE